MSAKVGDEPRQTEIMRRTRSVEGALLAVAAVLIFTPIFVADLPKVLKVAMAASGYLLLPVARYARRHYRGRSFHRSA
jgi:UPF0716 family protein affecting phage T7 exclusion